MKILAALSAILIVAGLGEFALAKDQEFRFEKADAQSVELMCECKDWKAQPMARGSDGVWTITVSISPGSYGYKFLVNGTEWVFDPKNPERKSVNGIENSTINISDDGNNAGAIATSTSVTSMPSVAPNPTLATGHLSPSASSFAPAPGETLTMEVPLSKQRRADAAKESQPNVAHARLAIAVPQNFDAQKSWPILVICNTETSSNIDAMGLFKQTALDEGWVVMAADSVESEKNKEGGLRSPTIGAAFDYVMAQWPGVKDWPVACGGHSGGAKNSSFLAADLAREHHHIIGILMSGCNADMATVAYRQSAPPNFLTTAIFLSSGKTDTTATPAHHEQVKNSLKGTGFQKVRLESFDGAHVVYPPHVSEALKWFMSQSATASSTKKESDFDKFFKKKP